tara:strand:- start:253 stop:666 length:414 start_codon:yes stop_codon:yes gene_type:complete
MINNGYFIIEIVIGLFIMIIIFPSAIKVGSHFLKFITMTFQYQFILQDHLFIDHLIRHDLAKSNYYEINNNKLIIVNHNNPKITYYIENNQLKRRQGTVKILTKQYKFDSFEYFNDINKIVFHSSFTPLSIVMPKRL